MTFVVLLCTWRKAVGPLVLVLVICSLEPRVSVAGCNVPDALTIWLTAMNLKVNVYTSLRTVGLFVQEKTSQHDG